MPPDPSEMSLRVAQIVPSRFHHFHLARQLERHGVLSHLVTGYPRLKLRDEDGIPPEKILSFPFFHALYLGWRRFGWSAERIDVALHWYSSTMLDRYAAARLGRANVVIALSSCGLIAGRKVQRRGGAYVCDRGSTHLAFQEKLMREEHVRWGLTLPPYDRRFLARERAEYAAADRITVPSRFVRDSFVAEGVPAGKLATIPYGARLGRFRPVGEPDPRFFTVLFVGQVSLRKGFLDLVDAFRAFDHPAKRLIVVGSLSPVVKDLLRSRSTEAIEFLGNVPNADLASHYSAADVMVLPSIEEGLSMVVGEAMACGCPVIATENTGAAEVLTDGREGYFVPIRDPRAIAARLTELAADCALRTELRQRCLQRVQSMGGWDAYGDRFMDLLTDLAPDL